MLYITLTVLHFLWYQNCDREHTRPKCQLVPDGCKSSVMHTSVHDTCGSCLLFSDWQVINFFMGIRVRWYISCHLSNQTKVEVNFDLHVLGQDSFKTMFLFQFLGYRVFVFLVFLCFFFVVIDSAQLATGFFLLKS